MPARKLGAVILMLLIALTAFPSIESQDNPIIRVHVLIDFGDGEIYWESFVMVENHTAIKATETACEELDLDLETEWFSFGVFVKGIGGLRSPDDWSWWWSLWVWNTEAGDWEASMEGASDLNLSQQENIAWSPSSSKPIAVPTAKYPWGQFQRDAHNGGRDDWPQGGVSTNAVRWIYDTNTKELPSSPVGADGRIIVNNWGGTYCLTRNGNLTWKNADVVGSFTPAMGSGKVLVGGKDGFLYSLNTTDGKQLWKTEITAHPGISGVTSPPTIIRGKVYVGAFNFSGGPGELFCLDEASGSVLWRNTTFGSVYFSSPAVSDDRVYVGTMGLYDSSTLKWNEPYGMYCFDSKNGDLLWDFKVDGSVGSSPTITGENVLFTSKDGYIYCLNGSSGEMIWKTNIGSSVSSPAVYDNPFPTEYDSIFVGSGDMGSNGKFYRLDMNGNIIWEFTPNGAVQSSPAIDRNTVYFATNVRNGTVYCLSWHTGELDWQYQPWPEDFIISSPAIVNGEVYIASDNGRLYCFGGNTPYFGKITDHTTQTLNVGEYAYFYHADKGNIMYVISINASGISLTIDPLAETFEVNLNEVKFIDTDGDGKKDLVLLLNGVNLTSQEASITLYPYTEPEDADVVLNMMVVSILALFIIGLVIMVVIILFARGISKKTEASVSGQKQEKDGS
ncbi:MAG: PQQ-binding-like beta-propeller repeat protein [Thermoplasmata archaeon]|nr:MAG: PQQ-binding-like beta-propeller repeat protein [Thermoplasmata archaeon]